MRKNYQLIISACCLGLPAVLAGQSAGVETGRIGGRIVDQRTGAAIREASIALLEDAAHFVRSDLDGRYLFTDVPAGQYTVRVFKAGYDPLDVGGVTVRRDQLTSLDIPLPQRGLAPDATGGRIGDDIYTLDAFAVTAEAVEDLSAGLLELRQRSLQIGDAIGSDFFSKAGIGDAAQAMSKIVGASVVDGKYVMIRGLGDRYSNTLLNGISVPSADPDRRAVQMDQFPADLLESIVTSKSFTPDQPGAFSGGSVNMRTRSFPYAFFLTTGASFAYNSQTTGKDILTIPGGGRDWLAMDDGTRRLPDGIPAAIPGATRVNLDNRRGITQTAEVFQAFNTSFDNRPFFPTTKQPGPNAGFSLSVGDQIKLKNERAIGYVFSLTYDYGHSHYSGGAAGRYGLGSNDPADPGFVDLTLVFDQLPRLSYATAYLDNPNHPDGDLRFGVTKSAQNVGWGVFAQVAYKWASSHEMALRLFHNQTAEDEIKRGVGESTRSDAGRIYERYNLLYTERAVASLQLDGKSLLRSLGDLQVDWRVAHSVSSQDQPDYRSFFTFWDIGLNEFSSSNGRNSRYFRDLEENSLEGGLDLTLPVNLWRDINGKFKIGGMYSHGEREYRGQSFSYPRLITNNEGRLQFPNPVGIIGQIGANLQFGNFLERVGSPPGYDAEQTITAGYIMADLEVIRHLRLIFGVRAERTELLTDPEFAQSRDARLQQTDWLPALSFVYELSDKMNLRAALGRTLARPTFKEITDARVEDEFLDTAYSGNPDLQMSQIDNYDLRWEWFPRGGEIVAVSAFYKDITNPIEVIFNSTVGAIQPQNRASGTVYGLEFEFRRNLESFSRWLTATSLGFNAAWIQSEVPIGADELASIRQVLPDAEDTRDLLGQSPYTFNVDVTREWVDWRLSATLLFNVVGRRLDLVNFGPLPDYYEQPSPSLDLTVSKTLGRDWKIKFTAKNILNSTREKSFSHLGATYSYERYKTGRTLGLSVSKSFL
jgi:hypothetical protein